MAVPAADLLHIERLATLGRTGQVMHRGKLLKMVCAFKSEEWTASFRLQLEDGLA